VWVLFGRRSRRAESLGAARDRPRQALRPAPPPAASLRARRRCASRPRSAQREHVGSRPRPHRLQHRAASEGRGDSRAGPASEPSLTLPGADERDRPVARARRALDRPPHEGGSKRVQLLDRRPQPDLRPALRGGMKLRTRTSGPLPGLELVVDLIRRRRRGIGTSSPFRVTVCLDRRGTDVLLPLR